MASHTRARSGTVSGPHSLSLKVLRLSRPSLATQAPLPHTSPFGNGLDVPPKASLAYPSGDEQSSFPLTPLLTLPSSFGAAYVGETFTCTLCVNNELARGEDTRKGVSAIRVQADLQTPTNEDGLPLKLEDAEESDDKDDEATDIKPGETLQRTLSHELKDEGPHVLVVTVTYTETLRTASGEAATAGRARTFRKLYQFVSQQLLAVRSKVTERPQRSIDTPRHWVLEAQIENVGETSVVLEKVWLRERDGIGSEALTGESDAVVLKPQDIEQVMFALAEEKTSDAIADKVALGQLNIDWRTVMGEKGSLTTGWLASRGKS